MTAEISHSIYAALKGGKLSDLSTDTLITLFRLQLVVPHTEDEFQTILEENRRRVDNSTTLDIVVQPSANCQLGCTYCGQRHSEKKAALRTQDLIIERVAGKIEQGKYNQVSVEWFGAEPLMAYRDILSMSERLIEVCKDRDVGFSAHMITNGLSLKVPIFEALAARRCTEFQVTLDGVAATHDQLRATKSGSPTFDIILSNIDRISRTEAYRTNRCSVQIRINVNKTSALEVESLLNALGERGFPGRNISVGFQPVVNWGDNNASKDSFSLAEFAKLEIGWLIHAMRLGFRFHHHIPTRRYAPCMVVQKDAEVYDASGDIYPCYEFPYTPKFAEDKYKIGNLETIQGPGNVSAVTRGWFDDVTGDVAPCKKCNLFPVCGGGCPKQWLHGERACPSFKENIEDRLALHYLARKGRLLDILSA